MDKNGRAMDTESSSILGINRPVAQLAERRSPKPQVGGSIPSWPAKFERMNVVGKVKSGITEV